MTSARLRVTVEVDYDPDRFDPREELQIGWRNPATGEISDECTEFSASLVAVEPEADAPRTKNTRYRHGRWAVIADVTYAEAIALESPDIAAFPYDQSDGCFVAGSRGLTRLTVIRKQAGGLALNIAPFAVATPSIKRSKKTTAQGSSRLRRACIAIGLFICLAIGGLLGVAFTIAGYQWLGHEIPTAGHEIFILMGGGFLVGQLITWYGYRKIMITLQWSTPIEMQRIWRTFMR